jgi:hypothetical protein
MPTETCQFCFKKFKNMQALRSHRALSSCSKAWERSLVSFSINRRVDGPVVNTMAVDAAEVDAPQCIPRNTADHSVSPPMEWEPGPENGMDDISVDGEGVHMLEEMPDGRIVQLDSDDPSEDSGPSDGNEDGFADEDDVPDSQDEGDEEYDGSGAEEPGIADDANVDEASVLDDQTCPVDEDDEENIVEEHYPGAGKVHRTNNSHFQAILKAAVDRKGCLHFPFANETELQLATWMHQSGLSMSKMDEFFRLKYVSM